MPSSKRSTGAARGSGTPEGGLLAGVGGRLGRTRPGAGAEAGVGARGERRRRRRSPAGRRRTTTARRRPSCSIAPEPGTVPSTRSKATPGGICGAAWPGPTYSVWPSWKPEASVQPSTDEPDTGTPSTAGCPCRTTGRRRCRCLPRCRRARGRRTRAPWASELTWPATADSTRSAPGPETPRQACRAATRAGEPGASTHSSPPPRRATTESPGRTSQRSGMASSLVINAPVVGRSRDTATPGDHAAYRGVRWDARE